MLLASEGLENVKKVFKNRLESMGSQRVGHNLNDIAYTHKKTTIKKPHVESKQHALNNQEIIEVIKT